MLGKSLVQVLFFVVTSFVMNFISDKLHLKIPGSILGIFFIFILLQLKVLRLEWVDLGSNWLLAEMLLFFIPPAAGMIEYKNLLIHSGLSIVLVVVGSTASVMVAAGFMAERIVKKKERGHSI